VFRLLRIKQGYLLLSIFIYLTLFVLRSEVGEQISEIQEYKVCLFTALVGAQG
jgi:hypothetical protein